MLYAPCPMRFAFKGNKMKNLVLLLTITLLATGQTDYPNGDYILRRIDENLRANNRTSESKMIVHSRRSDRTIEARSWIQGTSKSFTEYLAPPRDQGTKMLKLDDQLWTYSPSTDRIIKISGHMLRQSVMGSDLSYEDLMEDPLLHNTYTAKVIGEDELNGRACWVLDLTAVKEDVPYHTRKIWVDKERYLPLKEHRFAKSGKLLKTTEIKEVQYVQNRWFLKHVVFKDVLKNGEGTELILDKLQFDVDIPEHIFSKAVLRK